MHRAGATAGEVGGGFGNVEAPRQHSAVSKAQVVTISDGAFHGQREDASGAALVKLLIRDGFEVDGPQVVPDDVERIREAVMTAVERGVDLVVATGGTGLGPRDVTPQAISTLIDYEVRGIPEAMRRAAT